MVTQQPARIGDFNVDHVANYRPPAPPQELPRQSDARILLESLALVDRQFQNRTPEDAVKEERITASRIADTSFTLRELMEGLKRAYSTGKAPWNPIGAIFDEARAARAHQRRGQVVAALSELPPVPPSRGPVRQAYGSAVARDCPACNAAAGDPCTNPKTGTYRRMPCLPRKRA